MSPAIAEGVCELDLREARNHLPEGSPQDQLAFASRQTAARGRVARLLRFYKQNRCRMARLHTLTASSVALSRSCGYSPAFNALGDAIMPVDAEGNPRTPGWVAYQDACQRKRPWDIRDELWMEAHLVDWQALHEQRLLEDFFEEAARHTGHPAWERMRTHLEITVGSRQFDHWATKGAAAYETSMAWAMALAVRRGMTKGCGLLLRYGWSAARALFRPLPETGRQPASYRRCAWALLCSSITAWSAAHVYRRGVRMGNRGRFSREDTWPLLPAILGERVGEVHPLIVTFYSNPGRFQVKAALDVQTVPLAFYSRLSTLLLGQGLYESGVELIDARIRCFRRDDGSMHFVRELYCGESLRVFDSDFVVRTINGSPTLVEVFGDLHTDVVLDVTPRENGGCAVTGRDIYWRGIRLPRTGLKVEFASKVLADEEGREIVEVVGRLTLEPRSRWGRFVMHTLLRRPEYLGSIRYLLRQEDVEASCPTHTTREAGDHLDARP